MTSRRIIVGLAVMACLSLFTVEVAAHLAVVRTMPANASSVTESPGRVQVWFNQQPLPRVSRLELRGPEGVVPLDGLEVSSDDRSISAAIAAPLVPGEYEVTWRSAGDDGHVVRGTFRFFYQPPAHAASEGISVSSTMRAE
jgi:methionine-rich copper-binding protein CopC